MRAVRWVYSLSPKSLSPKFTGASPWRGFPGVRSLGGEPGPEQAAQAEEEKPAATREEMPLPGKVLLGQVVEEADSEGLEPARLIFREAGLVAAESLPRPHFIAALQRVAARCEAGRLNDEYVKDVIELVFRMATTDGQNVSHSQLAAVFANFRRSQGPAESRPGAPHGAGQTLVPSAGLEFRMGLDSRGREGREEPPPYGSDSIRRGSQEPPPSGRDSLRPGSQAWVLNDADAVVSFCRRAGIHEGYEPEWRRSAGHSVDVLQVDAVGGTVKCLTPSGVQVWLAAAALPAAGLQAPLPRATAADAEGDANYAVFRPLAEDIERHGMTVRGAFDVLREGRPGISEQGLRQIMDCYSAQEPPEARRRACARAWALTRMDTNGEISLAEFERLVARARAVPMPAGGGSSAATSSTAGMPSRTHPAGTGELASRSGVSASAATGSSASALHAGDAVSAYALVHGVKSQRPNAARVEAVAKDSVDVVFAAMGVRQRIPRDWVVRDREASAPDEAEPSEAPSSAADSGSHVTESRELVGPWSSKPGSCQGLGPGGAGLVGLENLGNSCYMNSIIQCLAGTVDLLRYFLGSNSMDRELNPENRLGSGGSVAREFAALLGLLWGGKQQGFWRPSRFRVVVAEAAEQFSGSEQQDAQEFAAYLLDVLHEDLNRVRGRKPAVEFPDLTQQVLTQEGEERAAAECWSLYLKRDKSIIVDIFQGQLRSQIRCLRCSFLSTKFDSFMYLSLPVVDAAGVPLSSLGDCLREFAREERLSGEERWYCPRCRDRVEAMKVLAVWKLPTVLLFHLKRFRFENGGSGGVTGGNSGWYSGSSWYGRSPWSQGAQKLNHKVDFSLEGLDLGTLGALPPSSPQKSAPVFDLFALVDHFGSCGYGHYTAAVWHEGASRWHRFDDENVAALNSDEVRTDGAYLLFFRRRGDVVRPQTRSAPEFWPHRVNGSWSFLRSERQKPSDRVYL